MEKLKQEFIELLEKDLEFRYTVAGFLGLSEILKRLDRLEEGQNKLCESQNKLWEEVKALRIEQEKMRKYMVSGFRDLRTALGVAFEDHAASFLELMLEEMGYPEASVERKYLVYEGEVVEINLFCEKPLVVWEATVSVKSTVEAEKEMEKLVKHVRIVEERYRQKPILKILSAARLTPEASETLKRLAEKHGVRLILGREIEETLAI